jgi:hypothetical protein
MKETWKLEGKYMEACTCEAPCPCTMLSDATEGICTALVGWHIESGYHRDLRLDGLNVALAVHSPENMAKGNWRAAAYVDDRANPGQREALATIFGGKAGGHPALLASHIGELCGLAVVPLSFETDGKRGRLRVGEVGSVDAEAIAGAGGVSPSIQNHLLAIAPGFPAVVGRSSRARFHEHGIRLDVTGKSALMSPFRYSG